MGCSASNSLFRNSQYGRILKMLTLKLTILIVFAPFTGAHKIYFLSIDFLAKDPAYYASHFLKIIKTAMQSKLRLPIELTVFL